MAAGLLFLGLYARRRAAIGTFDVDRSGRTLTSADGRKWSFKEIDRVVLARDWFTSTQLDTFPPFPHWCQAVTRDGDVLCLARGNGTRLRVVMDALAEAGLPVQGRSSSR